MERAGFLDVIGAENAFANIDDALNQARSLLGLPREQRLEPFVPTVRRESAEPPT
jgi:SulP family sulfate permease